MKCLRILSHPFSLFIPKFPCMYYTMRPPRSSRNFELKTPGAKFCLDFDLVRKPTLNARVYVYRCSTSFVRINASVRAEKRVSASRGTIMRRSHRSVGKLSRHFRRVALPRIFVHICISSQIQAFTKNPRQTLLSNFVFLF